MSGDFGLVAIRLISLFAGLAVSLTACVSYAPSADLRGQSRVSVLQKLGQPEREYLVDGKKKLQFPRGPGGSHTYFV